MCRLAIVFALLYSSFSMAESPQTAIPEDTVEEVLVIGEQPGPGLWKVSKDEHVLWIMGTLKPLPKKMTWHSRQVEEILAQSQEYITPPAVSFRVGKWDKVKLLPSLIGIRNNPDGKKLEEVVSPELYQRWLVLKEKYIGRDGTVEKWRPIFAANELYEKAVAKSGLTMDTNIMDVLRKVAKDNEVRKAGPGTLTTLENPKELVKKFKKSPLDDIECFSKTIERLETDLEAMKSRANAWATGDVAALRQLTYVDNDEACRSAAYNAALAEEQGLQDIPERKREYWLAEAELSLAKHPSTFSILPIAELLKPDGYLAALRAKGYKIEAPDD
ncbi:MAG TPA: TraB/GumN family protein [Cellvibrio sp.]|nr:TraB/GumN family protein [Cellvibrio sp.]